MKYVLGVDQGGTKTNAVVSDESGKILGMGTCGGACFYSKGMDKAMRFIDQACSQAFTQASITAKDISLVVGGIIGADWPHEYNKLGDAIWKTLGIDNYMIYNDCIPAFRAGTDRGVGSVLCLGTGMNTAVRGPRGEEFIFGVYVEDQDQGAMGLGIRAMTSIFRAQIGTGKKTKLTDKILRHFNLNEVDDLIFRYQRSMYSDSRKAIYDLFLEALQEGDEVSIEIIKEFARSISQYVIAGLERFDMLSMDVDVVLSGGVFKQRDQMLIGLVTNEIKCMAPNVQIINARYEPVVGTVLMALDTLYGGKAPDNVVGNIDKTAAKLDLIRRIG